MAQALRPSFGTRLPRGGVVLQRGIGDRFYSPVRPPRSLFVLFEGRVTLSRLTRDGKRLVTDVLQPGDVFGDVSFCGTPDAKEAAEPLTACCALALASGDVNPLIESEPLLASRLIAAVATRLNAAYQRLQEFAYSPVENRVASAVLRIAGRSGAVAPVSHQFVADMAGTYRETATRVLGELQMKELLQLGRCTVKITNPRALAKVAAA